MRKLSSVVCAAVLLAYAMPGAAADKPELKTEPEKNGYSVGYDLGRSIHRQLADVDAESMARGLKDAMAGAPSALPEQEMQQRFMTVRQESARKIAEKNKKDGEAFLARNKGEKGVKTTASGLQYKIITAGKGKQPTAEDTVTVNYRGMLIDGTEFDSSYKRNQPATFPVKGVIPGWTEALQLMKEGSKWMLYLPSTIAYGERSAGNLIGPNSALIFEVELLSINKPKE
ncbi:MAG TPA: FKBP-type peptidyl-prolyl cis-trans isomerase [Acidiferrobacterales bacterium]|nr:FKBP-type peptidyl-prolyl cis-trans isomerase [Acidiferrobacterales bacterium]